MHDLSIRDLPEVQGLQGGEAAKPAADRLPAECAQVVVPGGREGRMLTGSRASAISPASASIGSAQSESLVPDALIRRAQQASCPAAAA